MSKQIGPIQFQGKLGTIVGRATRKGTMSLSMAPTKYTNPNTPKQVTARARFLAVSTFTKSVPREAFAGLVRAARNGKMSLNNYAFKLNMATQKQFNSWNTIPSVEVGSNQEIQVMGLGYLRFSEGIYPSESTYNVDVATPGTLKVTFIKSIPAALGTKKVQHIIAYCPEADVFVHTSEVVDESADNTPVSLKVPASWQGLRVHVYAYTQFVEDGNTEVDYNVYNNISGLASWMETNSQMSSSKTAYLGTAEVG